VQPRRDDWRRRMAGVDPARLVFLDETGAHTAMTRAQAWGPKGRRIVGRVPQAHWQMTTLIAAVRPDAVIAPFVFDGATDGPAFQTYVERVLVPVLRPGDIVVWDNLAPHKGAAVRRAVEGAGAAVWPLPPYSPDLNPIEPLWSKVKGRVRKAGARTRDALWSAIGRALDAIRPEECRNYFAHCGYTATPDCNAL
jgi:transposase